MEPKNTQKTYNHELKELIINQLFHLFKEDLSLSDKSPVININSEDNSTIITVPQSFYSFDDMVAKHPLLVDCIHIAKKIALTEMPILLQGATGTGKNTFAHAIHNFSSRKNGAFITVDCHEHDEKVIEEELFGIEKNVKDSPSLLDIARGGTILFDNVDELSPNLQAKLLRIIENNQWRRKNGSKFLPINVRFISATTKQLEQDVNFREDLLYRLNVLSINLPKVKEIKEDIPFFIEHFLKKCGSMVRIDNSVKETLEAYEWPGNFREIINTVNYMLTVSDGRSLQLHDLPKEISNQVEKQNKKKTPLNTTQLTMMDKKEYAFILEEIKKQNENGEPASRRMITESSKSLPNQLTTQQVRHRLDFLEKHQYVTKGRGRAGTKITLEGLDFLLSLKENMK